MASCSVLCCLLQKKQREFEQKCSGYEQQLKEAREQAEVNYNQLAHYIRLCLLVNYFLYLLTMQQQKGKMKALELELEGSRKDFKVNQLPWHCCICYHNPSQSSVLQLTWQYI